MTVKRLFKLGRKQMKSAMLENTKKNQTEMKTIVGEMKITLEGINSRLDDTEEQTNHLEDGVVKI